MTLFRERWIGPGGPIVWPPRSPEFTPCDFFMWGAIKEMVYETPIDDVHVLLQRIMEAGEIIQTSPDIFVACRNEDGGHFEHLLWHVN